jgi:hypothetical protein
MNEDSEKVRVQTQDLISIETVHFNFMTDPTVENLIQIRRNSDRIIDKYLNSTSVVSSTHSTLILQPTPVRRKYLEDRSKNIILYGFETTETITNQQLKAEVEEFFKAHLHLEIHPLTIHLLGTSELKPLRICFRTTDDKSKIFARAHLLQKFGNKYRITNDYSYQERQDRKLLHENLNTEKQQGRRTKICGDILFVDGVQHTSLGNSSNNSEIHQAEFTPTTSTSNLTGIMRRFSIKSRRAPAPPSTITSEISHLHGSASATY